MKMFKGAMIVILFISILVFGLQLCESSYAENSQPVKMTVGEKLVIPNIDLQLLIKGNGDLYSHSVWHLDNGVPKEINLFFNKNDALALNELDIYLSKEKELVKPKENTFNEQVGAEKENDKPSVGESSDGSKEKNGYALIKKDEYSKEDKIALEFGLRRLDTGSELFIKTPKEIPDGYNKIVINYNVFAFMKRYNDKNAGVYRFITSTPQVSVENLNYEIMFLNKKLNVKDIKVKSKATKGISLTKDKESGKYRASNINTMGQINIGVYVKKGLFSPAQEVDENASVLKLNKIESFTKEGVQKEEFNRVNINYLLILIGILVSFVVIKLLIDTLAVKRIPMEVGLKKEEEEKEEQSESNRLFDGDSEELDANLGIISSGQEDFIHSTDDGEQKSSLEKAFSFVSNDDEYTK